jgi:hypothetical protein
LNNAFSLSFPRRRESPLSNGCLDSRLRGNDNIVGFIQLCKVLPNFLVVGLLLFFSMFRGDNVGLDTSLYLDITERTTNILSLESASYSFEIFYNFVCGRIIAYSLDPHLILYFFSILTFIFLVKAFKRFEVNISLGCFFFFLCGFYFLSLNIARQLTAVSIILYAYSFLQYENKKKYLFFLYVILAATIHFSSIVFILFYFIRYLNISKKIFILFATVALLYTFLPANILISSFIRDNNLLLQYQQYLLHADEFNESSLNGQIFNIIKFAFNIFIFTQLNKNNDVIDRLFIVSIVLDLLMFGVFGDFRRILLGILIIRIVYYARYFNQNKFNMTKMIIFALFVLVYMYEIFTPIAVGSGSYDIVPYNFSF